MAQPILAASLNMLMAAHKGAPMAMCCERCGHKQFHLFFCGDILKVRIACVRCEHPCVHLDNDVTIIK